MSQSIEHAKILWDYMLLHHELKYCDVAIVWWSIDMSTPLCAAKLYNKWFIGKIIFSGATWRNTTGVFEFTEAELYRKIAVANWVSSDDIYLESQATNTGANIKNAMNIVSQEWLEFTSLMLIHKPYMQRRFYATFEQQFPDLIDKVIVQSLDISFEEYSKRNDTGFEVEGLINMIVGDLDRIIRYPDLWFQSKQEIPHDVMNSYQMLTDAWYTQYL